MDGGHELCRQEVEEEEEEGSEARVDCNPFVANAAVFGDSYSWHQVCCLVYCYTALCAGVCVCACACVRVCA